MKDADYTQDDELQGVEVKPDKPNHPLDEPDVQARFRRLQSWRSHAADLQRDNRFLQMRDHDFYDGDQWTEEDIEELRQRGQAPLVFNQVKSAIDWIIGTERRTRVDYRVMPRERNDAEGADTKTSLLKYLSDVNRFPYARSRAFSDAVKSGVGWLEIAVRSDPTEEPLYVGYEDWRNVWYDPLSIEPDMGDARFIFRERYVDLDVALAMYPDRQDVLRAAAITGAQYTIDSNTLDDVDAERDIYENGVGIYEECRSRVKLTEGWYRQIWRGKIMRGEELGTLDGAVYDETNEDHRALAENEYATIYDAVKLQTRCMVYCENGVLQDTASPYRHDKFTLVPIWGFRKKRGNAPYGVIRGLVDPQSDLNKRRSKALFILSTNQVIADEDAVDDWDELAEEVSRPDGIIRKKTGKELDIRRDTNMVEEHVMLMQQDAEYIERTSGVTDEMMGRDSNAQSGRAILARQDQGHAVTAELFDNLRMGIQAAGEIMLSLIEQYYTDRKVIRIIGDRGQASYVAINEPQEDGSTLNDITARQADFVVDQMNYSASVRQAMFESMMNLLGQIGNPDIAMALMDIVVDLSDLPGKDEMVQRIRSITGQQDPDRDEDDPDAIAEDQAEATKAQQEAELAAALQQLEIAERQAKVAKMNAEAKAKEAGIVLDQERVRIQKAEALHKVQQPKMDIPPKAKPTDPNAQAQGNRPMVQPFRYAQENRQ